MLFVANIDAEREVIVVVILIELFIFTRSSGLRGVLTGLQPGTPTV